jgi:alanine racemase
MEDAARLTVDLDALAANLAELRREAAGAEVAPVVKANAYGLGLGPIAARLWAEGARRFFVARGAEGAELRTLLGPGRLAAIYVLDGCAEGAAADLAGADLIPVLNSVAQVRDWTAHARRLGRTLPAALHLDTGLNRLGLRPEELAALTDSHDGLHGAEVEVLMSHLACADDPASPMNAEQAARLDAAAARLPRALTSLAASAGVYLGPRLRGAVVRPGISLYGGGPFGRPDSRLRPVATLDAPVLQVRILRPGETVGYGATFTADRPMRAAVAAIGYADGVLRAAGRARYGWLNGGERALLGRISMDLLALDVSGCEAEPGQRVELFGANLLLDKAAADAGTIAYELLCNVSPRVRRVYRGEAA